MLKRKISCILTIAIVIGMLPLTAFATENEPVVSEQIPEETVCQHTESNTEYLPVMDEKTHTVKVVCICGEVVNQTVLDCTDESGDGKCDTCQQSLLPEEMVKETEPETVSEPEAEAETEPVAERETEPESEPETEPEISNGDVNDDGEISTEDAMCVLKYVAGLDDEIDTARADIDKDGMVTAIDAALILRYCAGLIDALPA